MIGFLNVYKPSGMTSHDVVQKVRRTLSLKQIGHGGTLDPLAEGVLPIAVGSACRLLRFLPHDKVYLAGILFGQTTDTDDIEGKVIATVAPDFKPPTLSEIEVALKPFSGTIMQRPPLYSAIHQQGKRLYELAREGKKPEIAEREVVITSIDVIDYTYPILQLRISCGGGTYIRSIARDLGEVLACGGCLQSLVREKSGPFEIAKAVRLDHHSDRSALGAQVESPTRALCENGTLAVLEISEDQKRALKMGQRLSLEEQKIAGDVSTVLAICNQELIAVCVVEADGKLKPEVVIADAG
jgi:tRNA pseudouridine55 synthase